VLSDASNSFPPEDPLPLVIFVIVVHLPLIRQDWGGAAFFAGLHLSLQHIRLTAMGLRHTQPRMPGGDLLPTVFFMNDFSRGHEVKHAVVMDIADRRRT
jgi:hypothetical protein